MIISIGKNFKLSQNDAEHEYEARGTLPWQDDQEDNNYCNPFKLSYNDDENDDAQGQGGN